MSKKRIVTFTFIIILLALTVPVAPAFCQQAVENIRQYRTTDDTLVIYYDLSGSSTQDITVEASLDSGANFTVRAKTLSGDTGDGIAPGRGKRIVWQAAQDGVILTDNVIVRIVAGGIIEPSVTGYGSKILRAVQTVSPVKFDGFLSDDIWKTSSPATGFIQRELTEGDPASERTEVKIAYDAENLYIGVMCYDSDPKSIIHNEMQRDVDLKSDDSFTVVIDTFGSYRNGYFFEINPNGARYDGFFYGTELLNPDWDGVWDSVARVTDQGWSAEIKIPFKTLRFPNRDIQEWGINFRRLIRRKSEEALWCSWRRLDGLYQLSRAGKLLGIEGVKKGRHLELIPFLLGGVEKTETDDGSDFKYGIDLRYPLTSDLTLDITTHTDFAQVETDRDKINLTRFDLFYPEKREFFLGGAEIFDYDAGYFQKVYHSRRIGISDDHEQIPILGGANLAGKVGPYSIGLLNIQTDSKGATPKTNYSVVRIKRDILERSRIGFIATNLYDENDHSNTTVGGDFFYQTNRLMGNKNFGIRGDVTGSFTDGDSDDNMFGRVFIDYPNDLIDSFAEFYHVGEAFNPEMGFITRTGIRRANGKIRVFPRPKIPGINKLIFMPLGLDYTSDLEGLMLERTMSFWPFGILTTSDDMLTFTVKDNYDLVDSDFTLSDTVIQADSYNWTTYGVEFDSNISRPVSVSVAAMRGGFYDGNRDMINPSCMFKLNKNIAASTEILYNDIELGGNRFITREYGGRLYLNLSTKLTSSTFAQYNNETSEVNVNFRLHFIPNMGSDLYFVYNHLWDESRDYVTKYRTAIVKLDYQIRL